MSETPSYPPVISNLFAPKQPVKFIEPIDYPIEQRKLPSVSPIGNYIDLLKNYNKESTYESTEGIQQKERRLRREKIEKQQEKMANDLSQWDPSKDPHVENSDPYKTVFVGRLNYKLTELELQQFFSKYGTIKKLRLVKDKSTSESKGYAFVEFDQEKDARTCLKEANGLKLMDRTMLVDIERSRLIKNWKPRRLGGGVGGRNYTKIEKEREALRERREAGAANGFRNNGRGNFARSVSASAGDRFNNRPHDKLPYDRRDTYDRREPRYNSRGGRGGSSGYSGGRGGGSGYRGGGGSFRGNRGGYSGRY